MLDVQRENDGDDEITRLQNDKTMITKRTVFLYGLSIISFCVTCFCLSNFIHNTRSPLRDDDLYHRFK
jgi:hypothetical protein